MNAEKLKALEIERGQKRRPTGMIWVIFIVVIGVMTGFDQDLKKRILSVNPEISGYATGRPMGEYGELSEKLQKIPGVKKVQPYLYTPLIFSMGRNISGGMMRGVPEAILQAGGPPALQVQAGSFADLTKAVPGEPPPVARGRMILYKAMCDLLWTLWGVIQHANGNPVDDFWAYAVGRLERGDHLCWDRPAARHGRQDHEIR